MGQLVSQAQLEDSLDNLKHMLTYSLVAANSTNKRYKREVINKDIVASVSIIAYLESKGIVT